MGGTVHSWFLVVGAYGVLFSPILILVAIILWETVVFRDDIKKLSRAIIFYLPPVSTVVAGILLITENPSRPEYGYAFMKLLFLAAIVIVWVMAFFGKARIKSSPIEIDDPKK